MKALITLTDIECAIPLNASLEQAGIETVMVSPLDDIRREIKRAKPDVIVITGAIADPNNVQLVREQLWEGVSVIGLADVDDVELRERLRSIGFVDVYAKPVATQELVDIVKRALDRQSTDEGHRSHRSVERDSRSAREDRADGAGVEHGDDRRRERNGEGARRARNSPA